MSERGPQFDAARVLYEASQARLLDLIDQPEKGVPVNVYRRPPTTSHTRRTTGAQSNDGGRGMDDD